MDTSTKYTRARRMVGSERDEAPILQADQSTRVLPDKTAVIRSKGGKVDGGKSLKRLDKPVRARGGSVKGKGRTTVNVIVSPQGGQNAQGASPMPVPTAPPPMMGGTPPMPPGGAPGAPAMRSPMPGGPPAGMPMRAKGGAVKMTAGAGSALGRLEKAGG